MKARLIHAIAPLSLAAIGWALYALPSPLGGSLERTSYDFPFWPRGPLDSSQVVLVFVDEVSAAALEQPPTQPWDRAIHARLLDRLTREGARAVLFDIIFDAPGPSAEVDAQFAEAIRRNGRVILSGITLVLDETKAGVVAVRAPLPILRSAAVGWGLATLELDPDGGVRRLFAGTNGYPASTTVLASVLGRPSADAGKVRWMNFYGPAGSLRGVSYERALSADGVPPGFFRDKIVLVGARRTAGLFRDSNDEFAGPLTRWGGRFYAGVEVHAQALLNRLDHTWLERLSPAWESGLLLAAALFAGLLLPRFTPVAAAAGGVIASLAVALLATGLVWYFRLWWSWLIPAAVQIPLGVVYALGAHYFPERRRQRALRRAFSHYLSPHMADKIAATQVELCPGGELVESTVMFTDLAGFTAMAEELDDPAKVAELLIQYYSRTTACILEEDGTIIKYMGDSVEAVWNAPLPEAAHARRACIAALRLQRVAQFEANGQSLLTRVGIHTGPGFAGNLGSESRFDYAVIGDTTNFASRLEGLNKVLGTQILISQVTLAQSGGDFLTRPLGAFRVAGKKRALEIFELLGEAAPDPAWLADFKIGLAAYRSGDQRASGESFRAAHQRRAGGDPPSLFYLQLLQRRIDEPDGSPWTGVVEIASK